MNSSIDNSRLKSLNLYDDEEAIANIASALSVPIRRSILKLVNIHNYSISDIALKLNIPVSTISFHVKTLVAAGLLKYSNEAKRIGNQKRLTLNNYMFTIYTGHSADEVLATNETQVIDIPVGSYTDYAINETPCGLVTSKRCYPTDAECFFSSPQRFEAGIIWMKRGFLEYSVPMIDYVVDDIAIAHNPSVKDRRNIISLCFSFEVCSEYPGYNQNCKSDLTFFVNGIELCTYTSSGDYGERRGKLNPDWWLDSHTQYGLLTTLDIRFDGTYLNEKKVSDVCVEDLNIGKSNLLKFRIAVKDDARHVGGFNLFGKNFGDHSQDIKLLITYKNVSPKINS